MSGAYQPSGLDLDEFKKLVSSYGHFQIFVVASLLADKLPIELGLKIVAFDNQLFLSNEKHFIPSNSKHGPSTASRDQRWHDCIWGAWLRVLAIEQP